VAPIVVQEWLTGMRNPSPSIRTSVLSSLRNFRPGSVQPEAKPIKPPMAASKPEADKKKISNKKNRVRNRREGTRQTPLTDRPLPLQNKHHFNQQD